MENTEKTKKILTVSVIALLVLALVSMFFAISTMARYTTGGTGTGTVGVAKWDVKLGDGTAKIDFGKLSPNMNAMNAEAPQALTNTHNGEIKITNSGDVDAIVTVDLSVKNATFTFVKGDTVFSGTDVYTNGSGITDTTRAPSQAEVERLFSMQFNGSLDGVDNTEENIVVTSEKCYIRVPAAKTTDGTITPTVVTIGVDLVWTTDYVTLGAVADHLDTWVGENVSKIEWGINFIAVQGSELPSGDKADLPVSYNIDATGMDADALKAAVEEKVAQGFNKIIINNIKEEPVSENPELKAADSAMFIAISQGLAAAKDGSIDLTINNVTTIPAGPATGTDGRIVGVFESNTKLKSISLPDATTIAQSAFKNCASLTKINLPKAETIDGAAFGNTPLTEVYLPAATTIGMVAFAACTSLTMIDLPAATNIGQMAFYECTNLKILKLTTEAEITKFDDMAFIDPEPTEIILYLNAKKENLVTGEKKNTFNEMQFKEIYCGDTLVTTPTAA